MAATGKASWNASLFAFLVLGVPSATSITVQVASPMRTSVHTQSSADISGTIGYNAAGVVEPLITNGDFSTSTSITHNRPSPDLSVGEYYTFDLGGVYDVNSIAIATGNANWGGTESPREVDIYTGSSLSGPWAYSQGVTNTVASSSRKDFSLSTMQTQYVRLHWKSSHGNNHIVVRQVGFGGFVPTTITTTSPAPTTTSPPDTTLPDVPQAGGAAATGDPHLQNVLGQRFDLMKPGKHVLINIPRGRHKNALLRVQADARQMGGQCADMYFQELNITGAWVEAKGTGSLSFRAHGVHEEQPKWLKFGKVQVKVAHGRTLNGAQYLNFYVKHLGHSGFAVGGLLGEDDHADAAMPSEACVHRASLLQLSHQSGQHASELSVAEASFV